MKYRFRSREQVLESPMFDFASPWKQPLLYTNRCTRATRLQDMIYRDLHGADKADDHFLRDVFQMLYAHDLQKTARESQTPVAREFHGHALACLLSHERFPALKAICEGQDGAAHEAAVVFAAELAGQMRALEHAVSRLLAVLERLENRNRAAFARLHRLAHLPGNDDELIAAARKTASTTEQIQAVTHMIRDALHKRRAETEQAVASAAAKAEDAAALVRAASVCWGGAPGASGKAQCDSALMQRIRGNEMLQSITRQLGRMKEMLSDLRKNAYAYGRGEKYALTLGRDLKNVLSAELGLLAAPETAPLFLRRYNAKSLRQYARRDMVRKGGGDIIVCLDESNSTEGENAVWAKALALALQDICAHEERRFALIHFSSASQIKADLFLP